MGVRRIQGLEQEEGGGPKIESPPLSRLFFEIQGSASSTPPPTPEYTHGWGYFRLISCFM